jgi:hypothetical protein
MFASWWLRSLQRRWFPRRGSRAAPIRRGVRLCLEVLEERLTPSTYTVTDASDTAGSASDVTLRYAISQAVSNHDPNAVINFSSARQRCPGTRRVALRGCQLRNAILGRVGGKSKSPSRRGAADTAAWAAQLPDGKSGR